MTVSVTLVVKGSRYYGVASALASGALAIGAAIRLVHEPHNPYDPNAVAVRLGPGDLMLGHLARDVAPKYAALVKEGRIKGGAIARIVQADAEINIYIHVSYDQAEGHKAALQSNRFWHSASALSSAAGVYGIQNVETCREYIGSSSNPRDRAKAHLKDLLSGTHANHVLQSDFRRFGADQFEVRLIRECPAPNLVGAEREILAARLRGGHLLYNLTTDGQGIPGGSRSGRMSGPISERNFPSEEALAQLERSLLLAPQRRKIHAEYDPRLAALLPPVNFWMVFALTFVPTALSLDSLAPNMTRGMLILVAAIISGVIADRVLTALTGRAKRAAQYLALLRERDAALAALEREHAQ